MSHAFSLSPWTTQGGRTSPIMSIRVQPTERFAASQTGGRVEDLWRRMGTQIWPRSIILFFSELPTDNRIHRVRRRRSGRVRFHSPNLTYSDACASVPPEFLATGQTLQFFFFSISKRPLRAPRRHRPRTHDPEIWSSS